MASRVRQPYIKLFRMSIPHNDDYSDWIALEGGTEVMGREVVSYKITEDGGIMYLQKGEIHNIRIEGVLV